MKRLNTFIEEDSYECKINPEMWKDYFGCEMKEIDFYGHEDAIHEHTSQFNLIDMREMDFSEDDVCLWEIERILSDLELKLLKHDLFQFYFFSFFNNLFLIKSLRIILLKSQLIFFIFLSVEFDIVFNFKSKQF